MASINFRNISKSFGNKVVLRDIDISVDDGEFLVLLGPSGCGKSTLLRMLAGLESVSGGEILIGDKRVDHLPPGQRDMAFVFQSYALYPHLSVRSNMVFPLLMERFRSWYHLPVIGAWAKRRIENSPEIIRKVERTAEILALGDMLEMFPRTLSGGQRQRVALGRAMVREPAVFLMDEPLSNLDAKLRTTMRAEISRLHAEIGGTFVYVTHDQVEAMTMGTRIALMREGVIQQIGSAREIYSDPANTYVARFIGTPPMNLIEATLNESDIALGAVRLPRPAGFGDGASGKALFGIRPNAITVHRASGQHSIQGQVVMVEHVGAESVIAVRPNEARTTHASDGALDAVMVTVPGYAEFAIGDAAHLQFDAAQAVLFSAETGARIRS